MRVAIVTFDGFNELDSFIALGLINRLRTVGVHAEITSPSMQVTSMNGVTITAQQPLEFVLDADAVLFGSGIYTRAIAENAALMDRIVLDPTRQLIGAQCSGTLQAGASPSMPRRASSSVPEHCAPISWRVGSSTMRSINAAFSAMARV